MHKPIFAFLHFRKRYIFLIIQLFLCVFQQTQKCKNAKMPFLHFCVFAFHCRSVCICKPRPRTMWNPMFDVHVSCVGYGSSPVWLRLLAPVAGFGSMSLSLCWYVRSKPQISCILWRTASKCSITFRTPRTSSLVQTGRNILYRQRKHMF